MGAGAATGHRGLRIKPFPVAASTPRSAGWRFNEDAGFVGVGEPHPEDELPHIRMQQAAP